MRKVRIFSTRGSMGEVSSSAETYGQLRRQLIDELGISTDNMKVIDGTTKVEYSASEAVLPTGDIKLYLVPEKTKSGTSVWNVVAAQLAGVAKSFDAIGRASDATTQEEADAILAEAFGNVGKGVETVSEEDEARDFIANFEA